MSKRLFIAYKLPPELRNEMRLIQHKIRNNIDPQGINWVNPDNMHITIAFLGQIDEKRIDDLQIVFNKLYFSPLQFMAGPVKYFSRNGSPAVFYQSVLNQEKMQNKAEEVRGLLADAMINYDRKPFNGHITIARAKIPASGEELAQFIDNKLDRSEPSDYTLNSIILYESRFQEGGPKYIELITK